MMVYDGFRKIFRRLFVWFCRNYYTCAARKSLNIGFFMEEGMVCEKQKLAGITMGASNRIYLT